MSAHFIRLTNAHPNFKNNELVINTKHIVTVHNTLVTREDDAKEQVTFVHCPPHGTWEVTESVEEVLAQLREAR